MNILVATFFYLDGISEAGVPLFFFAILDEFKSLSNQSQNKEYYFEINPLTPENMASQDVVSLRECRGPSSTSSKLQLSINIS